MMFGGTKERELVPVNSHPAVMAAREKTSAARAEVDKQETIERELRDILDPRSDSATSALKEITVEMIAEASTRLIPRRFGVTLPSHADTAAGNAARQVLKAAKAEEAQIRDEVRKELEQHVRDRVADVIEEFADAFEPCRKLAEQLLDLQDTSGINFPQVHSCLRFSNVENELRRYGTGRRASAVHLNGLGGGRQSTSRAPRRSVLPARGAPFFEAT